MGKGRERPQIVFPLSRGFAVSGRILGLPLPRAARSKSRACPGLHIFRPAGALSLSLVPRLKRDGKWDPPSLPPSLKAMVGGQAAEGRRMSVVNYESVSAVVANLNRTRRGACRHGGHAVTHRAITICSQGRELKSSGPDKRRWNRFGCR